jgi:hypothetical protein
MVGQIAKINLKEFIDFNNEHPHFIDGIDIEDYLGCLKIKILEIDKAKEFPITAKIEEHRDVERNGGTIHLREEEVYPIGVVKTEDILKGWC